MNNELLAQITALPKLPLAQIKKIWRDLYQAEPPAFNRTYLVSRLTYRLQELAWDGDLSMLNKRLEAMARTKLGATGRSERKTRVQKPLPGTKLLREYHGIEHQVTVMTDGFAYQGRKFKSLSRIAEIITGTQWSGPAFFGLVSREKKA